MFGQKVCWQRPAMFGKKKIIKKFKCSRLLEGDGIESRLPFKIFSTLVFSKKQQLQIEYSGFVKTCDEHVPRQILVCHPHVGLDLHQFHHLFQEPWGDWTLSCRFFQIQDVTNDLKEKKNMFHFCQIHKAMIILKRNGKQIVPCGSAMMSRRRKLSGDPPAGGFR